MEMQVTITPRSHTITQESIVVQSHRGLRPLLTTQFINQSQ